jgi:predicted phosphodiesterase
VHGEHVRLGRVLDWLAAQNVDAVICTGDVADGAGCLDTCCALLAQADVATVAGNHDRWLLTDRVRHVSGAHRRDRISSRTLEYLSGLPAMLRVDTVLGSLLLCHGVEEDDLAKVWPGTARSPMERNARLDGLLARGEHRFVVNGHLHYRVLIDFPDCLLMNAGTLKGPQAGVSIIDFADARVAAYEIVDQGPPRRLVEHALHPGSDRVVWRDTQAFDGTWTPCTLHR